MHKVILQGKGFKILLFVCESVQHSKEEQRHGLVQFGYRDDVTLGRLL